MGVMGREPKNCWPLGQANEKESKGGHWLFIYAHQDKRNRGANGIFGNVAQETQKEVCVHRKHMLGNMY